MLGQIVGTVRKKSVVSGAFFTRKRGKCGRQKYIPTGNFTFSFKPQRSSNFMQNRNVDWQILRLYVRSGSAKFVLYWNAYL